MNKYVSKCFFYFFIIFIFSFVLNFVSTQAKESIQNAKMEIVHDFTTILDSLHVVGSILIYNPQNNTYYSNDFEWAKKGRLPASTFKIPNSIIALETAVVKDENYIFKWNGEKRRLKVWEQDLSFKRAYEVSCVPCYQEIAKNVGVEKMKSFLQKFDYPGMLVTSKTIANFWLEGESKISQFEQISFLKKFYELELPISANTYSLMRKIMVDEKGDNYTLSGKTGWAIRQGGNNGWFVGFIETNGAVYYFAVNVEPKATLDMDNFYMVRKNAAKLGLQKLGIGN